jgi:hypothetical protein
VVTGPAQQLADQVLVTARVTEGGQLSATTVVIQYTTVRTSHFREASIRPPHGS